MRFVAKFFRGVKLFPYKENWYRHRWDRATDHLGLDDVNWHTLRHTCANRLADMGEQMLNIKEWLGHKAIQTTMRYAHLSPTALQGTENRLSARVDAIGDAGTHK